jgi:hypothetical protein
MPAADLSYQRPAPGDADFKSWNPGRCPQGSTQPLALGRVTSSAPGNIVRRSCFRILLMSCAVWSTGVHRCTLLPRAVVTHLVTQRQDASAMQCSPAASPITSQDVPSSRMAPPSGECARPRIDHRPQSPRSLTHLPLLATPAKVPAGVLNTLAAGQGHCSQRTGHGTRPGWRPGRPAQPRSWRVTW